MACLPKHERYGTAYLPGDIYWGLGIENETYIELLGGATTVAEFVRRNQKRERYSVDYWTIYKPGCVSSVIDAWIDGLPLKEKTVIKFPLLANGHTFMKTDRHGEPMTTYTRNPQPNPKFAGTTLYDDLCRLQSEVFRDGKEQWWTFDGDTVEFMTQHYYCAKMEDVIQELLTQKKKWLAALQAGLDGLEDRELGLKRTVAYPAKNYGLAVFLTNRRNIAIFNNGTYHINITLPTYLDKEAKVANMTLFESQHRCLARLFQWLSPFLLAKYGSGDVFANLGGGDARFPSGSQRLCASRFVSVGVYDTGKMEKGKLLSIPNERCEGRWYESIYDLSGCAYKALPALGVDINYNKHWNHGLEFRIFDWFPECHLPDLFRFLIWMCDESLALGSVSDPRMNGVWNAVLARTVWDGSSAMLSAEELAVFSSVFRVPQLTGPVSVLSAYDIIWNTWMLRWNNSYGTCTHKMIRHPLPLYKNAPTETVVAVKVPVIVHVPAPAAPPAPAPAPAPGPAPAPAPAPAKIALPEPPTVVAVTPKHKFFCC